MKTILIIILLSIVCISASVIPSLITVIPATPKVVRYSFCDVGNGMSGNPELREYISRGVRDGFIVKTITITSDQYRVFVVMEKY